MVAGSVSFGAGAALAATHASSHPAKKPVVHPQPASNVHYPCRHHGNIAALL